MSGKKGDKGKEKGKGKDGKNRKGKQKGKEGKGKSGKNKDSKDKALSYIHVSKLRYVIGVVSGCFVHGVSPSPRIRPEPAPEPGLGRLRAGL